MSGIKKLAGQTLWYGVPRIFGRFLNFGISLLGFRLYEPGASSYFTQVYAVIPFLTIIFTYGLETSYFRFAQTHDRRKLYNTLNVSIIISTVLFTLILFLFKDSLVSFMEMEKHPEFVTWMLWIVFFDTLIAIPMAKLRLEERLGRPVRAFSYVKGSEAHYKPVHLSLDLRQIFLLEVYR